MPGIEGEQREDLTLLARARRDHLVADPRGERAE
jgi:hypothetical protein